ncbi:hypothetical protein SLA2020_149200 [Shorea laevis]
MLPISIRCKTCGNFISKGNKFKSRQERRILESGSSDSTSNEPIDRLSLPSRPIPRIPITLLSPVRREILNLGVLRMRRERQRRKREFEEMGDPLKSLENKTLDFKREMDNLAALDELKSLSQDNLLLVLKQCLMPCTAILVERKNLTSYSTHYKLV